MTYDYGGEWNNPFCVSWRDGGRTVDVEIDGSACRGTLEITDTSNNEDGDEVPIFDVNLDDGRAVPFNRLGRWRFVDDDAGEPPA